MDGKEMVYIGQETEDAIAYLKELNESILLLEKSTTSLRKAILPQESLLFTQETWTIPTAYDMPQEGNGGSSAATDMASMGFAGAAIGKLMFANIVKNVGMATLYGGLVGIAVSAAALLIDQIINSAREAIESENDAFQSTFQDRLSDALQEQANDLAKGITLASNPQYDSALAQVTHYEQQNQVAMGEGYLSTRKIGLNKASEFQEQNGGKIQQANDAIGAYYAYQENVANEYEMDAQSIVMGANTENDFSKEAQVRLQEMQREYAELESKLASAEQKMQSAQRAGDEASFEKYNEEYAKIGAQMGSVLIQAECLAKAEYAAGEGAQEELQRQTALIDAVAADTALQEKYYNTGMILGERMSRGIKEVLYCNGLLDAQNQAYEELKLADDLAEHYDMETGKYSAGAQLYNPVTGEKLTPNLPNKAYGLPYVPYDGYRARLHEGERVLTAQEARGYGKGGGGVTVTGNTFTIREEADVDRVAAQLYAKIRQAQMIS